MLCCCGENLFTYNTLEQKNCEDNAALRRLLPTCGVKKCGLPIYLSEIFELKKCLRG